MDRRVGFGKFAACIFASACLAGNFLILSCESAAYAGRYEAKSLATALLEALEPPANLVTQNVDANHNSYRYTLEDDSHRARMVLAFNRDPTNQFAFYSGTVQYELRSFSYGKDIFIDGSLGGTIANGSTIANDATYATAPAILSWAVVLNSAKDASGKYTPVTDGKGNSFTIRSLTYTISGEQRGLKGGIGFGDATIQVDVKKP